MSDMMERIRKLGQNAKRRGAGGGQRLRGIFHTWNDGDNHVRLVGDFLEVWTHFIAPAAKRNERGLCRADAFKGDDKLPQVINCLNWDVEAGTERKGGCPICKLNSIAAAVLSDPTCTPDEKAAYTKLRTDTFARQKLKWNVLDRDNPFVVQDDNGEEKKVRALKISDIGPELWKDIEGIFTQMQGNIADDDEGIDIVVTKAQAARTTYAAKADLDTKMRPPQIKMTKLTAEEREMKRHDLKQICGKQVSATRVVDALHEDLRELLEINVAASDAAPAVEPSVKDEDSSRKAASAAADDDDSAPVSADDDDGLMSGVLKPRAVSQKKT